MFRVVWSSLAAEDHGGACESTARRGVFVVACIERRAEMVRRTWLCVGGAACALVGGMSDFGLGMSDVGCGMADGKAEAPTRWRSGIVKAGSVEVRGEWSCWLSGAGGAMGASVAPRSRVGFVLGVGGE